MLCSKTQGNRRSCFEARERLLLNAGFSRLFGRDSRLDGVFDPKATDLTSDGSRRRGVAGLRSKCEYGTIFVVSVGDAAEFGVIDTVRRRAFNRLPMKRLLCLLFLAGVLPVWGARPAPAVREVAQPEVLPLALTDEFEFRKVKTFLNDSQALKPTANKMIKFQREQVDFGAVTEFDRLQREGHYYTFFWRAKRTADLTVRLEYRQTNLGPFVLAKEVDYPAARGSHHTKFQITGDDYREDGRVTQWRVLLIENGRIVGLTQSYLWN